MPGPFKHSSIYLIIYLMKCVYHDLLFSHLLYYPVTSVLLAPVICLSTSLWQILILYYSLMTRHQILHLTNKHSKQIFSSKRPRNRNAEFRQRGCEISYSNSLFRWRLSVVVQGPSRQSAQSSNSRMSTYKLSPWWQNQIIQHRQYRLTGYVSFTEFTVLQRSLFSNDLSCYPPKSLS